MIHPINKGETKVQYSNTSNGHGVKSYRRRQKTVQFHILETDANLEFMRLPKGLKGNIFNEPWL